MRVIWASIISTVLIILIILIVILLATSCQYRYVVQKGDVMIVDNKATVIRYDTMRILPKDTVINVNFIYKKRIKP